MKKSINRSQPAATGEPIATGGPDSLLASVRQIGSDLSEEEVHKLAALANQVSWQLQELGNALGGRAGASEFLHSLVPKESDLNRAGPSSRRTDEDGDLAPLKRPSKETASAPLQSSLKKSKLRATEPPKQLEEIVDEGTPSIRSAMKKGGRKLRASETEPAIGSLVPERPVEPILKPVEPVEPLKPKSAMKKGKYSLTSSSQPLSSTGEPLLPISSSPKKPPAEEAPSGSLPSAPVELPPLKTTKRESLEERQESKEENRTESKEVVDFKPVRSDIRADSLGTAQTKSDFKENRRSRQSVQLECSPVAAAGASKPKVQRSKTLVLAQQKEGQDLRNDGAAISQKEDALTKALQNLETRNSVVDTSNKDGVAAEDEKIKSDEDESETDEKNDKEDVAPLLTSKSARRQSLLDKQKEAEKLPDHPLAELLTQKKVDTQAVRDLLEELRGDAEKVDLEGALSPSKGLPPPLFYAVGIRSPGLVALVIEYQADVRKRFGGNKMWNGIRVGMTAMEATLDRKLHFKGTVLQDRYEAIEDALKAEEDRLRGWNRGRRATRTMAWQVKPGANNNDGKVSIGLGASSRTSVSDGDPQKRMSVHEKRMSVHDAKRRSRFSIAAAPRQSIKEVKKEEETDSQSQSQSGSKETNDHDSGTERKEPIESPEDGQTQNKRSASKDSSGEPKRASLIAGTELVLDSGSKELPDRASVAQFAAEGDLEDEQYYDDEQYYECDALDLFLEQDVIVDQEEDEELEKQAEEERKHLKEEDLQEENELISKKSLYTAAATMVCEHIEAHPSAQYDFQEKLGEGTFGVVRVGAHKETGIRRAIKSVPKMLLDESGLWLEIEIMRMIDHPNIMRLFTTFEDAQNVYMVTEFCGGGELFDALVATDSGFSEQVAAHIVHQMMSALCYLHNQKICHRDLKPENFLLSQKENLETALVKLIDFGTAKRFWEGEELKTKICTLHYVAPEILSKHQNAYTEKCDLWSMGVLIYLMLCGQPPFFGETDVDILKKIKKGRFAFEPVEHWEQISDEAQDMIKCMIVVNPEKRYSADQAVRHAWVTSNLFDDSTASTQMKQRDLTLNVVGKLRQFLVQNRLKKVAMQIIAQHLSDEEISGLRTMFLKMDVDNKGTLQVSTMEDTILNASNCTEESKMELRQILSEFVSDNGKDAENDMTVNYTQFLAATLDRKQYLQKNACRVAFNIFDVDGNGQITKEELALVLTGEVTLGPDVQISLHDAIGIEMAEIERIVAEVDQDGDGEINFQEFMDMMCNQGGLPLGGSGENAEKDKTKDKGSLAHRPTLEENLENISDDEGASTSKQGSRKTSKDKNEESQAPQNQSSESQDKSSEPFGKNVSLS